MLGREGKAGIWDGTTPPKVRGDRPSSRTSGALLPEMNLSTTENVLECPPATGNPTQPFFFVEGKKLSAFLTAPDSPESVGLDPLKKHPFATFQASPGITVRLASGKRR